MERELEGAGRQGGPAGLWRDSALPSERGRSLVSRRGGRNSQAEGSHGRQLREDSETEAKGKLPETIEWVWREGYGSAG